MKELWVEKYRPKTLDGYVFRDEHQKVQIQTWIKDKSIPHLIFSGNAGIGKTTLAKILFNMLEINDLDILEINASRTNSVEDVRAKIVNFVQMIPFGDFKVVLLDEADYLTPNASIFFNEEWEGPSAKDVMQRMRTGDKPVFISNLIHPDEIIFDPLNVSDDEVDEVITIIRESMN